MKKSKLMLPLALLILASCGGGTSSGTPAGSTPASETPASETPASETPASDTTPASETPASESPASETPASESTSEAPAPEVVTIQRAREIGEVLATNGASTNKYSVTGTVTAILGSHFTIQTGDYAIYVYQFEEHPQGFEIGKSVTVTGFIKNFRSLVQIAGNNATATDPADPVTITVNGNGDTISRLTISDWSSVSTNIALSSRLVEVPNLLYVSGSHTAGSSSGSNITFKQGSTNITLRIDAALDNSVETAIVSVLSGFTTTAPTISYQGVLGTFVNNYSGNKVGSLQLAITTAADLVVPPSE